MLRLALLVLVDAAIGLALAAVLLALAVPSLIRRDWIAAGDLAGALVIGGTLVIVVAIVVFRPGSAINRHTRRDE